MADARKPAWQVLEFLTGEYTEAHDSQDLGEVDPVIVSMAAACLIHLLAKRVLGDPVDVDRAHQIALRRLGESKAPKWQIESVMRHFADGTPTIRDWTSEQLFEASMDAIDLMLDEANYSEPELDAFKHEALELTLSKLQIAIEDSSHG